MSDTVYHRWIGLSSILQAFHSTFYGIYAIIWVMNKMTEKERAITRRVRQARKEKGLTQAEVAEALSLSPPGYSHYEQFRQPFTIGQIFILAERLEVPIWWLLGLNHEEELTDQESYLLMLFRQIETDFYREELLNTAQWMASQDRKIQSRS